MQRLLDHLPLNTSNDSDAEEGDHATFTSGATKPFAPAFGSGRTGSMMNANKPINLPAVQIDSDTDLNAVSETDLKMAKAHMDIAFRANQRRPGDKDFVYDKQVT